MNRRQFVKKAGVVAGTVISAPTIIPASVLGKNGAVAPSEKITMACIGVGWQGTSNMENFLQEKDAKIIAVCDVDKNHLQNAKNTVNGHYGNKDCETFFDFREVLARPDIDAVSLGLPDHWHAIPAIMAAKAGKDIYGEKPLSHSLLEGRAMCDAVKRYNRIWQTGSWQRSLANFRFACELVRNGRIGKVKTVEVGLPAGHTDFAGTFGQQALQPPPPELDYDFWLGPAPFTPYAVERVHKNWRWHLDYGGGQIMDWVGHHVDIAHWGLDLDRTGPVEVSGKGEYPKTGFRDTATRYWVETRYANGIEMILAGGYRQITSGTKWIGENGWVWVNRGGINANPKNLLREKFGAGEVHLYESPGHFREFLDCIKTRHATLTPCETGHRSATPGHLGQISMLLGRKIQFNPDT
ncbi:Gfo/Idh/MocA family oxidoreductase, partial [candidate division KSB1 bacterium]|nr:Gfo/Idh/MocA family oxidoreductase [candidate division KSB1 bacterium]